ncbi:MAG TPA: DMT family transporter [Dehalococcoidia bacterium]|nr:DMT family transporter [Dehalococcoidia bacterium]
MRHGCIAGARPSSRLGAREATWVSILGTLSGLAIVVVVQAGRQRHTSLPSPLNRRWVVAGLAVVLVAALLVSARDIPLYFALTGTIATVFLILTGVLVPRLGLALFFAAVTLGTVGGALVMDDLGAFGTTPKDASLGRALGVGLVAVGTVIVRRAK